MITIDSLWRLTMAMPTVPIIPPFSTPTPSVSCSKGFFVYNDIIFTLRISLYIFSRSTICYRVLNGPWRSILFQHKSLLYHKYHLTTFSRRLLMIGVRTKMHIHFTKWNSTKHLLSYTYRHTLQTHNISVYQSCLHQQLNLALYIIISHDIYLPTTDMISIPPITYDNILTSH